VCIALLALLGPLAACGGSDDAASDDSAVTADAPSDDDTSVSDATDTPDETSDDGADDTASDDTAETDDAGGGSEPVEAEVRDSVTNVRESFDDVVEVTSDDGVLVVAGLACSEDGLDPFMMIAARGLTGDATYVAEVDPPLSFELDAVAQPDGTFRMAADADPEPSSYTITLADIGSGVTLEVPGCAS